MLVSTLTVALAYVTSVAAIQSQYVYCTINAVLAFVLPTKVAIFVKSVFNTFVGQAAQPLDCRDRSRL